MRLSDESLRGRIVIAGDGRVVGEVAGIFLGPGAERVEALQIKLRNEVADLLGKRHHLFQAGRIEIPVRMVQSVGETVVLSVGMEALGEVAGQEAGAPP